MRPALIFLFPLFLALPFAEAQEYQRGTASYYADYLHGLTTANYEIYDKRAYTGAHDTLPFGTIVRVTNQMNQRAVDVRINDRQNHKKRHIDLSRAAAEHLDMVENGLAPVTIHVLSWPQSGTPASAAQQAQQSPSNAYGYQPATAAAGPPARHPAAAASTVPASYQAPAAYRPNPAAAPARQQVANAAPAQSRPVPAYTQPATTAQAQSASYDGSGVYAPYTPRTGQQAQVQLLSAQTANSAYSYNPTPARTPPAPVTPPARASTPSHSPSTYSSGPPAAASAASVEPGVTYGEAGYRAQFAAFRNPAGADAVSRHLTSQGVPTTVLPRDERGHHRVVTQGWFRTPVDANNYILELHRLGIIRERGIVITE